MVQVCTNCANGSYDYGVEKLFCNGKVKNTNTPCENWTDKIENGRITYSGWTYYKNKQRGI